MRIQELTVLAFAAMMAGATVASTSAGIPCRDTLNIKEASGTTEAEAEDKAESSPAVDEKEAADTIEAEAEDKAESSPAVEEKGASGTIEAEAEDEAEPSPAVEEKEAADTMEAEAEDEAEPSPAVDEKEAADTMEAEAKDKAEPSPAVEELDISKLEARLRATRAIGFFTKLALKNQVGDLMDEFRLFHARKSNVSIEGLRDQFDLLLMKIVTLLQDDDPELFEVIVGARELLWNKLADFESFTQL